MSGVTEEELKELKELEEFLDVSKLEEIEEIQYAAAEEKLEEALDSSYQEDIEEETEEFSTLRIRDSRGRFAAWPTTDGVLESVPEELVPVDVESTGLGSVWRPILAVDPSRPFIPFEALEHTGEGMRGEIRRTAQPSQEVWCHIPGRYMDAGELNGSFFEEELEMDYEMIDGMLAFPKVGLEEVFTWLHGEDELSESGINSLSDLVVTSISPNGVEILGPSTSVESAPWCVLEDVVFNMEAIKDLKIPTVSIGEGISFPEEHLQAILKIHELDNIGEWFTRPGSSAEVTIYSRDENKKPVRIWTEGGWNGYQETAFREITEEVLAPIVKTDIQFQVPHGRTRAPTGTNTLFKIFLWSTPRSPTRRTPPIEIWDIKVNCRDSSFQGSDEGIYIYDPDTSYIVAELLEYNLYIHHDINHIGAPDELKIYRRLLEEAGKILNIGFKKYLIESEKEERLKAKETYVERCGQRTKARIKNLEKEMEDYEKSIGSGSSMIVSAIRGKFLAKAALEGLYLYKDKGHEDYEKEFDKLKEIKGITDVRIRGNLLIVDIADVYIMYKDHKYHMGKYRMNITLGNELYDIRIVNLNPSKIREGYYHPHINGDGGCCFGNLAIGLSKLMGEYQYSIVIQILLKYINAVNDKDWSVSITRWK